MCDYSLMAVPNRLAQEGEELVTYRFPTGSLGLASPKDLKPAISLPGVRKNIWKTLRDFFDPPQADPVCAVCVPPGARLRLDSGEDVTFTQLSAAAHSYRDAFQYPNGRQVRLQELREGLHMRILDLSLAEERSFDALHEELPLREA